jgi:hypothetical protein
MNTLVPADRTELMRRAAVSVSVLEPDGPMMNVSVEAMRIMAEYSSSEMTLPELEEAIAGFATVRDIAVWFRTPQLQN